MYHAVTIRAQKSQIFKGRLFLSIKITKGLTVVTFDEIVPQFTVIIRKAESAHLTGEPTTIPNYGTLLRLH
jgi:hypothetical protein